MAWLACVEETGKIFADFYVADGYVRLEDVENGALDKPKQLPDVIVDKGVTVRRSYGVCFQKTRKE